MITVWSHDTTGAFLSCPSVLLCPHPASLPLCVHALSPSPELALWLAIFAAPRRPFLLFSVFFLMLFSLSVSIVRVRGHRQSHQSRQSAEGNGIGKCGGWLQRVDGSTVPRDPTSVIHSGDGERLLVLLDGALCSCRPLTAHRELPAEIQSRQCAFGRIS